MKRMPHWARRERRELIKNNRSDMQNGILQRASHSSLVPKVKSIFLPYLTKEMHRVACRCWSGNRAVRTCLQIPAAKEQCGMNTDGIVGKAGFGGYEGVGRGNAATIARVWNVRIGLIPHWWSWAAADSGVRRGKHRCKMRWETWGTAKQSYYLTSCLAPQVAKAFHQVGWWRAAARGRWSRDHQKTTRANYRRRET